MSIRSAGYSVNEDILLCRMHLDVSQDPITGVNQSRDQFCGRVVDAYNNTKEDFWESHTKKSLQHRMQMIEKAIRKLNGCVRQVENLHPSGASEQYICTQAKALLMQDPNFKKGFKFDHVWVIMMEFEKFNDVDFGRKKPRKQGYDNISSESENPTPDSPNLSFPNLSLWVLDSEDILA
ncbi:PREDICTED: uncharacterized protein LOC109218137 [Nicotiana attenuata]|uniref:uncharacterized protein LOC109218137 n=1 Tax=Nicotiana attenuata TaxID=49451 RepID=UPI0009055341|nr:PREDICTED: uncharacterized protein LOC109218137 [Nicotiana attenuata]